MFETLNFESVASLSWHIACTKGFNPVFAKEVNITSEVECKKTLKKSILCNSRSCRLGQTSEINHKNAADVGR
jgi:hypothetical protein